MDYPAFVDDQLVFSRHPRITAPSLDIFRAQNFKSINEVLTRSGQNEELIQAYLETGVRIFQMETGVITRIENQELKICHMLSAHPTDQAHVGISFPLQETYCHEVYKRRETTGFPEVSQHHAMSQHPHYQAYGVEAYLATPIIVAGEFYGM